MYNDILDAITRRLDELFGGCEIYTDPVKQGSYMAVIAQIIRASAVNWDSRSHAHTHIHIRFIGNAHLHQFLSLIHI